MSMRVESHIPQYGVNYRPGYIGFTFTDNSFVSLGIAYFTRHELSRIPVSHAFVVAGNDRLVEAHALRGVAYDTISKYFNDPHVHVFFRKPLGWTERMGNAIAHSAERKIGCAYGYGLIAADLAADTWAGYWANRICQQWPRRFFCWLLNSPAAFICSELAAYALNEQPEFHGRGVLAGPLDTIDPQDLFEDETIFEPWKNPSGDGHNLNPIGNDQ